MYQRYSGLLVAVSLNLSLAGCGGGAEEPVSAGSRRRGPANVGATDMEDVGPNPDAARSDREPDRFLREGAIGTVSLVIDGDTVHVTVDGWYHRVRLQGINAPECSMSLRSTSDGSQYACTADDEWWGLGSNDALRDLIEGETVTVFCDQSPGDVCPTDDFDRFLAFLEGPEGDIAEAQARNGHAMSFTRFSSTRRATYCQAEDDAIAQGLGMWSLGDRDTVLNRMSDGTRGWYLDRDELCAEAVRDR